MAQVADVEETDSAVVPSPVEPGQQKLRQDLFN